MPTDTWEKGVQGMCLWKRFLKLTPILAIGLLIGALLLSPMTMAQGNPPVPPRPTIPPPGVTLTPSPGGGDRTNINSQLKLALIVDKSEALPGDQLSYKAQVSNAAGAEATNVWLTCDLPPGLEVQEATTTIGEVHNYGDRISFQVGKIAAGYDTHFMTVRARIVEDTAPGTVLVYHANLTSDQAGGGERSVTTLILGQAQETETTVKTTAREGVPLPVTGGNAFTFWVAIGFLVLLVGAAIFGMRERLLPPR